MLNCGRSVIPVSKALHLKDMLYVLKSTPLEESNFDDFFVDTAKARGSDVFTKICLRLDNSVDFSQRLLLVGHSGCGKSTELYRLKRRLSDKYCVVNFSVREEIDIENFSYLDFIFTILSNILLFAESREIKLPGTLIKEVYEQYNTEHTIEETTVSNSDISIESSAGLGIKFPKLIELMTKLKGQLQLGTSSKDVIRKRIEPNLSHTIKCINEIITCINSKLDGKRLLLIIEDLDKLDIEQAEELFYRHRKTITSIDADTIYTFPVFLYYSPDFQEISVDFDADFLLSMIKTNEEDGTPCNTGRAVLKDIIYKRVDSALITEQALDFAIDKSGGILRQIFYMLENGALEALTQGKNIVDIEHVKLSYTSLKNTFVRALKSEYIDCLNDIIHEPKLFGNNEILMKLLRSLIVIEYNGERWCGVNPIVLDIMRERGLISEPAN